MIGNTLSNVKNILGWRKFFVKNLGEENVWLKIIEEFLGETILGINTNFVLENIMEQTETWSKFWVDFFSHKKCLGQKNFWSKESLGQKFCLEVSKQVGF